MQSGMSFLEGFMCSFFRKKSAYVVSATVSRHSDSPSAPSHIFSYVLYLKNSAISMLIGVGQRIAGIFRRICQSQIRPSVIRWIVVNMIDIFRGPLACHVGPDNLVGSNAFIVNSDSDSAFFGFAGTTSEITSAHLAVGYSPFESTRFPIVGEIFPNERGVKSRHLVNIHRATTVYKS